MSRANTFVIMRVNRSTPRLPKRSDSRETVRAILLAAERLSAEGVDKLRMSDVGKLAGVASSTLYEYFPSKAALVFALEEGEWSRQLDALLEPCAEMRDASLEDIVRETTVRLFDFVASRGPIFALRDQDAAQRFSATVGDRIVDVFERAMSARLDTARREEMTAALRTLGRLVPALAWFGSQEDGASMSAWRMEVVGMVVRHVVRDTPSTAPPADESMITIAPPEVGPESVAA